MVKSKVLITLLCVAIVSITVGATILKVYQNHQEKLILVAEKRLNEAARKCIIDEVCNNDNSITLKTLIENKYLDRQVHPISKEYLDENLEIKCEQYQCNVSIN